MNGDFNYGWVDLEVPMGNPRGDGSWTIRC